VAVRKLIKMETPEKHRQCNIWADDEIEETPKPRQVEIPEWKKAISRRPPPIFDPTDSKDNNASDFIEQISNFVHECNISERESIDELIPSCLSGNAKRWLKSQSKFKSFVDFAKAFKHHYRIFYASDTQLASLYSF